MSEINKKIQDMNLSNKWRNERKAHTDTKAQLKQRNKDYDELMELFNVLKNDYAKQEKIVEDYQARFINGGVVYTINNDFVSSAIKIPPYSEWTYDQDIPKEIGTILYNMRPFVKIENRQLVEDTKQKSKYKGAII